MMGYSVTYWEDGAAIDNVGRWENLPKDNVLWVTVRLGEMEHELLGADGYWLVPGVAFGVTYEDAQPRFGGALYRAWGVMGGAFHDLGEQPPPPKAKVIRGVELPDEVWEHVRQERLRRKRRG